MAASSLSESWMTTRDPAILTRRGYGTTIDIQLDWFYYKELSVSWPPPILNSQIDDHGEVQYLEP